MPDKEQTVRRCSRGCFSFDKLRCKCVCMCWGGDTLLKYKPPAPRGLIKGRRRGEGRDLQECRHQNKLRWDKVRSKSITFATTIRRNRHRYKHILLITVPSESAISFSLSLSLSLLTPTQQTSIIISQINSHMHCIIINTSFCSRLITFTYSNSYLTFNISLPHIPLRWAAAASERRQASICNNNKTGHSVQVR